MNTVKTIKAYAHEVSSGVCEKIPSELLCSVMVANNRILAAAIIENGGTLVISPESIHEMLTSTSYVVAVAAEDGSLTITLAPYNDILAKPEALAL